MSLTLWREFRLQFCGTCADQEIMSTTPEILIAWWKCVRIICKVAHLWWNVILMRVMLWMQACGWILVPVDHMLWCHHNHDGECPLSLALHCLIVNITLCSRRHCHLVKLDRIIRLAASTLWFTLLMQKLSVCSHRETPAWRACPHISLQSHAHARTSYTWISWTVALMVIEPKQALSGSSFVTLTHITHWVVTLAITVRPNELEPPRQTSVRNPTEFESCLHHLRRLQTFARQVIAASVYFAPRQEGSFKEISDATLFF